MGSVGDLSARSSKRTVSKSSKVYRVALEAVEIVRERDLRILELTDALHRERIRAEAAEDDVKEIVKRFKIVHGQKTAAVAEAAKWKAEMLSVNSLIVTFSWLTARTEGTRTAWRVRVATSRLHTR